MDNQAERAVRLLREIAESNEDNEVSYSGKDNIKKRDILMPDLVQGINNSPERLRISERTLENKLSEALVSVKESDNPIEDFETELDDIEQDLREIERTEYIIAFPLNFDRRSEDLLPDNIQIEEVTFDRITKTEWESEFVPEVNDDIDEVEFGGPEHQRRHLRDFVERSPNQLTPAGATFWKASYYARDLEYAVDSVIEQLSILLGELNYALQYDQSEGINIDNGPWPTRLSNLRHPFVYLVFDGEYEFQSYYYNEIDATPRKVERVHSLREELFEEIFSNLPSFTEEHSLDPHLKKAFKAYQSGITNPSQKEAFFELWRVVEILSLVEQGEPTRSAIERAGGLFDWQNPELTEIRESRVIEKRNKYVHDGQESEPDVRDKNFVKLLVDGLLDHYISKRDVWSEDQMRFSLDNFTSDADSIHVMKENREEELEVLDWMEEASDQPS